MYMPKDKEFYKDFADMACVFVQPPPPTSLTFTGDEGRKATLDFSGEEIIYSGDLPVDESARKLFEAFYGLLKAEPDIELRQLLWLRHGCSITHLYGDDGEMQCSTCLIDFKRDSPEKIKQRFVQLGIDKIKQEILKCPT
jgi:hypothetical protein